MIKKNQKPKVKYDKESRVLSFEFSGKKSVDSDIRSNAVIDYSESGEIVRINFHSFNFNNFRRLVKPLKHSYQLARSMGLEVAR